MNWMIWWELKMIIFNLYIYFPEIFISCWCFVVSFCNSVLLSSSQTFVEICLKFELFLSFFKFLLALEVLRYARKSCLLNVLSMQPFFALLFLNSEDVSSAVLFTLIISDLLFCIIFIRAYIVNIFYCITWICFLMSSTKWII